MSPSTIAQVPPRKLTQPPQRWSPFGLSRYWADALLTFRRPAISCSNPSSSGRGMIGAAHAGSAVPASAAPQRVLPIKLRREMDSFFECLLTGVLQGLEGPFAVSQTIKVIYLLSEALFRALPNFPLQRREPSRASLTNGRPYYLFFPPYPGRQMNATSWLFLWGCGTEQDQSRRLRRAFKIVADACYRRINIRYVGWFTISTDRIVA
jgi:hypothetical protein